ncbi:MAG: DUF4412 domain-containing protein [Ignavibacteriales bacterium]|jgi:hypothetical protein|nr:DUF4412 domain-containing protein [Melioribacteraceae bacterium]RJP60200.1 MAG: DUF4412 domain-containing protein [Ignavibacteriales bacterium]
MRLTKIFFLFFLGSIILSAQSFEGFVKYKMTSDGESMFMNYYKKGENVRMEPEMEEMAGAVLFKEGKTYMLMPTQNMYMEFDMEKFEDLAEETESNFKEPIKTGETKDILGYSCEKWIFEDEEFTTEVWAAKGLGEFIFMSMPMGDQEMPSWYKDLSAGGFFPMHIIAKDKSGKDDGSMEVVEIKEQSVPASMFEIPSNYQKFSMPGMN